MRLWTVHPRYLDRRGLLAVWREGLLAQAVLRGRTRGYTHHPQLRRFREQRSPVAAIATYLDEIHRESVRRGYRFDRARIARGRVRTRIPETRGQLRCEWERLRDKLKRRSPSDYARLRRVRTPQAHPLFEIVPGAIREWEKGAGSRAAPPTRRATPSQG